MLSLSKARQLLGENADNMTDGQVEDLIDRMYGLADLIFDIWKEKRMRMGSGAIRKYERKT